MTDQRQIAEVPDNQISMNRGFPVYRTNPSVPASSGVPTRSRRFQVPGGKGAMIVDHSTSELKGIGGMGFWWEEEVDSTRFVKLFLDGIKQTAGLSKSGMQVFELVYHQVRANPGSDEIKLSQYVAKDETASGMSSRNSRSTSSAASFAREPSSQTTAPCPGASAYI